MSVTDPFAQDSSQPSQLTASEPPGGQIQINEDGSAEYVIAEEDRPRNTSHFDNLVDQIDPMRAAQIATELLDAIEIDKQAREKRDEQYETGLRRTGLGDEAPAPAPFNGASKAVHPVLLEASLDFSARAMSELLPPDGPCKECVIGEITPDKQDRAKRTTRYLNYQITEMMSSAYHEFEMGLTQMPLGGAFYTKMYENDGDVQVMFIPIDKVHRPWGDGDFYSQPRITHEQEVDKYEFHDNVRRGLWADVVDPDAASDLPDETRTEQANDRIIGRTQPTDDPDNTRTIFEASVLMPLEDDDDDIMPYLVTIDVRSRKLLSIYRNWQDDDPNAKRLDFLQEWGFWPWRGGYPIGMTHMIGGLSGAATGALRALLDAAFINTVQTGVKLKGGATSGGQDIRPNPGSVVEVQGSLAMDDIRKTYMQLPFNQPSPVLFELLGFLVDGARGVVRTTFDEYDKFGGNTPVGTAQMFIEQGLKNMGAIHARLHRTMRRFLKQLWEINSRTVDNVEVMDKFGELMVTREDFQGPIAVVPVSDPRIFSDLQRSSIGQLVAQRAQLLAPFGVYNIRKTELYFLKSHNVPNPDEFLNPQPEAQQTNAVAENVLASLGMPIKVFPSQDHEAHLATHMAFMSSQLFGQNPVLAPKFLPAMLAHIGDHVAQWYAAATLDAANAVLRATTGMPNITIESFQAVGNEVQLDRLLAELQPQIIKHADQQLGQVPQVIAKAQMLLKQMQPPQPMDPSIVAMKDVERQGQKDQADIANKAKETQIKLVSAQADQQAGQADQQQKQDETALKRLKAQMDAQRDERQYELQLGDQHLQAAGQAAQIDQADRSDQMRQDIADATNQSREDVAADANESREQVAHDNNETQLEITRMDTQSAKDIAKTNAKARKSTRMTDGGSMKQ